MQTSAVICKIWEAELVDPIFRLETEIVASEQVNKKLLIFFNRILTSAHDSDMDVENEHNKLRLRVFKSENHISSLDK